MTKVAERAKPAKKPAPPPEHRRELRLQFGARGRELLGVGLIALTVYLLLALSGQTAGRLSEWWSDGLYWLFGWGAFIFVALLGGIGALQLARTQHFITAMPWRTIIAFEVAFFAFLPVLHAFASYGDTWRMIEQGNGGGVIGWGLLTIAAPLFSRVVAGLLFLLIAVTALVIGVPLPWLTWLDRLTVPATPSGSSAAPKVIGGEAAPSATREEALVEPQTVIINRKQIDREPVQATQLPLKVIKATEPPPLKVKREYPLPSLDLLEEHTSETIEQQEIEHKSYIIEETLRHFGLAAKVVRVSQGPAVTQFGVEPGYVERPGPEGDVRRQKVRVAQISSLQNDLALALSATSLRIEAPVPGQSFVGIEVPNDTIARVGLRGVLESEAYGKLKTKASLACALGRDVSGAAVSADLASMPHILIAGTTGSGKSVCINTLIMSLLMSNTPDDLRLVMIDPKMVELIRYNGLPHLYGKVETELDRIVEVLRWVTREMDARYKKFSDLGVRHISEFNAQMLAKGEEKLPYLGVFIDELSDLMMGAPVEVEKTICRIAQMARATGIHLVIATQRPSTDVVTGLIKANFPARIAFAVASGVDSRVILDGVGAEALLGKGDMLFQSPTANGPQRIQGCYVGELEIDRVAEHWRGQCATAEYAPAPWEASKLTRMGEIAQSSSVTALLEDDDEVLLSKAIEVVKKHRQASASLLQRKMSLGFPKAAALLDEMERMGIVGPAEQAGRTRKVLIGPEDEVSEWM